jgi:linearmycin/streptolysin S transport system permease protein
LSAIAGDPARYVQGRFPAHVHERLMRVSRQILALSGKDLRLLLRDRGGAFVTFVFPFVYSIFFGLVLAARNDVASAIPVALVDDDHSPTSVAFAQRLADADELAVSSVDRDNALDLVRRGQYAALIVLPVGFGARLAGHDASERPRIEFSGDPARRAELAVIRGVLTESVFEASLGSPSDRDDQPARNTAPRTTNAPRLGGPIELVERNVIERPTASTNSYAISFPQGVIWGVLGCCASFSISIATERSRGTLSRLRIAPIGRSTILAGKAAACLVSIWSLGVCVFGVGWLAFGVTPGSIAHLAISLTVIPVAFVGIMMLLSTLGRTERSTGGISWAVLLAMAMLGGGMVPAMFMPHWMQTLGVISPVRWAILAMEGAVWRGFSTVDMLTPWIILLVVGVVCFAIGAAHLARMDEG